MMGQEDVDRFFKSVGWVVAGAVVVAGAAGLLVGIFLL